MAEFELIAAASRGDLTATKRILAQGGVSLETEDAAGQTPLHLAAYHGNKDVVAYLIEAGADVEKKTHDGFTALALAEEGYEEDTADVLKKALHSVVAVKMMSAAQRGDLRSLRGIIEGSDGEIDINGTKDGVGQTPLHIAAYHGHKKMVQYLLKKGADADQETDDGMTPFNLACLAEEPDAETPTLLRKASKHVINAQKATRDVDMSELGGTSSPAKSVPDVIASEALSVHSSSQLERSSGTGSANLFDPPERASALNLTRKESNKDDKVLAQVESRRVKEAKRGKAPILNTETSSKTPEPVTPAMKTFLDTTGASRHGGGRDGKLAAPKAKRAGRHGGPSGPGSGGTRDSGGRKVGGSGAPKEHAAGGSDNDYSEDSDFDEAEIARRAVERARKARRDRAAARRVRAEEKKRKMEAEEAAKESRRDKAKELAAKERDRVKAARAAKERAQRKKDAETARRMLERQREMEDLDGSADWSDDEPTRGRRRHREKSRAAHHHRNPSPQPRGDRSGGSSLPQLGDGGKARGGDRRSRKREGSMDIDAEAGRRRDKREPAKTRHRRERRPVTPPSSSDVSSADYSDSADSDERASALLPSNLRSSVHAAEERGHGRGGGNAPPVGRAARRDRGARSNRLRDRQAHGRHDRERDEREALRELERKRERELARQVAAGGVPKKGFSSSKTASESNATGTPVRRGFGSRRMAGSKQELTPMGKQSSARHAARTDSLEDALNAPIGESRSKLRPMRRRGGS